MESLVSRIERLRRGEGDDDEFWSRVVVEVESVLRAIRNVEIAGHQLQKIGSPRFRRPKNITYEDIILYHTAVALNEGVIYDNRVSRLFKHFERQFLSDGNAVGLQVVRTTRQRMKSDNRLRRMRRQHVHEQPFVPPALTMYAAWGSRKVSSYRRRQMTAAYKRTARLYGRTWTWLASVMDAMGEFYLDIFGLLMTPSLSREDAETELERITSRLNRTMSERGVPQP